MTLDRYDDLLRDGLHMPSAITLTESCVSVTQIAGGLSVVYPPTFAGEDSRGSGERKQSVYNIDEIADGENVCLLDSVGSQANRMETMFGQPPLSSLVPKVTVKAKDEKSVRLVDVGHRIADALVRYSDKANEIGKCFDAYKAGGDAEPMAKLAPTSLLFGVWDSRGTHTKVPRILSSAIFATNVTPLTRHAQYVPPVDYDELGILPSGLGKKDPSKFGFAHAPNKGLGGVVVRGVIQRTVDINLTALRAIRVGDDEERTLELRRYIFGLALAALTTEMTWLRQGAILKRDLSNPPTGLLHWADGTSKPWPGDVLWVDLGQDSLVYAKAVADAFKVGPEVIMRYDKAMAEQKVKEAKKKDNSGDEE